MVTITFNGYDLTSEDLNEINEFLMQFGDNIEIEVDEEVE